MIPEIPARQQFARMYRTNYDAVFAYALAHARLELATDATADTFLIAWRRFEDIPEVPLPWLIGIARRSLSGMRRSEKRRGALMTRLGLVHCEPCCDLGDEVAERDVVLRALGRLRPSEREVLLSVAMANLSPAEAAAALGCSRGAFDVRLHRARARFAATLREEERPEVPVMSRLSSIRPAFAAGEGNK